MRTMEAMVKRRSGRSLSALLFLSALTTSLAGWSSPVDYLQQPLSYLSSSLFPQRLPSSPSSYCKPLSSSPHFPPSSAWAALNTSISGRLHATIPIGTPCHDPNYDAAQCAYLRSHWTESTLHDGSSHSIMAPYFANRSCDVWTPREWPCEMGNYVAYSLEVREVEDLRKGLAFVRKWGIRVAIRNTGHDYLGRSTAPDALALWTHHLKDIEILDYASPHYTGKAMKMGAGVQGFEAYQAADRHGLAVVGGECPTVGLAGGYTQGGGHSALSSRYGLAADQTLEWEVVTAQGDLVTASRAENEDLYWALSGGGAGNYGVVYSMTVKAYPDVVTSGLKLGFTKAQAGAQAFWDAITFFHAVVHTWSDQGGMTVYVLTAETFGIVSLTMPGKTKSEVEALAAPLLAKLDSLGIQHGAEVRESKGYLEHHDAMFDLLSVGIAQYGGWLVPQTSIDTQNTAFTSALREVVEDGSIYFGVALNVSQSTVGLDVHNAVHPAWRTAGISAVVTSVWDEKATWEDRLAWQKKLTDEWIPKLRSAVGGEGVYMNEGDFRQRDWKTAFYGEDYERLLAIKEKWDPEHMFHVLTGVGSDYWTVEEDGRLCRAVDEGVKEL